MKKWLIYEIFLAGMTLFSLLYALSAPSFKAGELGATAIFGYATYYCDKKRRETDEKHPDSK